MVQLETSLEAKEMAEMYKKKINPMSEQLVLRREMEEVMFESSEEDMGRKKGLGTRGLTGCTSGTSTKSKSSRSFARGTEPRSRRSLCRTTRTLDDLLLWFGWFWNQGRCAGYH